MGLIATLGIVSLVAALAMKADRAELLASLGIKSSPSLASGSHHDRLKMSLDIPGSTDLTFFDVGGVELQDEADVVGVEVGGEACCFVMANMFPPELGILNATVGGRAVSLTYGSIEDRVRVFTADQVSPIPLGVGGIDVEDRLVLLLGGERYTQCSSAVPLQDVSYVRTTWSQWRDAHAATKICVPGGRVYGDESYAEASYGEESSEEGEALAEAF